MSKEINLILVIKDRKCTMLLDDGRVYAECSTLAEVKEQLDILGLIMPVS